MKKLLTSRIFIVIITALICITGSVYAANLISSSEVSYRSSNVQNALDDLYTKVGAGSTMLAQDIVLTTDNTFQLPLFDGYTWVSDNEGIMINSSGLATVGANGDVYLVKDNVRYIKYNLSYTGPTILFISGKYGSYNNFRINDANGITSSVAQYLTDGIKTRQGTAGALMFIEDEGYSYIKFVVARPCTITFSTGGYSDGGGNSTNRTVNFYKLNSNNEETLYTTFKTKVAEDYETQTFEVGTYILRAEGRYPEFDEWTIVEN